ncbi:hypothetical protein ES706_02933 [subsurface metagenome]
MTVETRAPKSGTVPEISVNVDKELSYLIQRR